MFEMFQELGVTHVSFVLGRVGIATIPVAILEEYRTQTKTSFNPDGSIRHYHVLISNEEHPVLYWSSDTPRYPLEECYQKFS